MHVHLLKDSLQKRVTTYPWVPTRHMRGDLFNKSHQPSKHQELCAMNGIHMMCGITHVPAVQPLEIFGWEERVKVEKAEAAKAAAADNQE